MIESSIGGVEVLLLFAAVVAMVSQRAGVPYTIGLVVAGAVLAFLPIPVHFSLSKELIFTAFLPPLVFEAAMHIRWQELRRDLPVVSVFASAGVVLSSAIAAVGMHFFAGWEWSGACLFGALISATDPVSVIATFKEAGVKGRMRLLMEAESLLNDGTAAVVFVVALAAAAGGAISAGGRRD